MSAGLNYNGESLRAFFSRYPLRHFKKDRPLYYQGEIPQSVFFIKNGVVKFYNITAQGEEKIIGYDTTDGIIPVEWIFSRTPVSLYYYDTFTDCQLYSVPRADLIDFINKNHIAATTVLNRLVSLYTGAKMHLHALEQSKASDKLLYILQYLDLRFGTPIDKTHSQIELRLTHQDIANLIGITRETVSTEMGKLAKSGVIKSKNLYYVIDTDKAVRMLGENDFEKLVL